MPKLTAWLTDRLYYRRASDGSIQDLADIETVALADLSFRQTLGAAGSGSETHLSAWASTHKKPYLHISAELPPSAVISGILRTTTAVDPAAPTADDIQRDYSVLLAGSALGGLDKVGFSLGGGARWTRLIVTNVTASPHEVKVKTTWGAMPITGAALPIASPIKKDYGAPIMRAVLAGFKRGTPESANAETDDAGNLYVRSVPNRASQAPGRTPFRFQAAAVTANQLLGASPGAGFRYIITSYVLTGVNTSTIAMGAVHLRETDATGTILAPHTTPTATAGANAPQLQVAPPLPEPITLAVNTPLFLHIAAGTLTISILVLGYIEAV